MIRCFWGLPVTVKTGLSPIKSCLGYVIFIFVLTSQIAYDVLRDFPILPPNRFFGEVTWTGFFPRRFLLIVLSCGPLEGTRNVSIPTAGKFSRKWTKSCCMIQLVLCEKGT